MSSDKYKWEVGRGHSILVGMNATVWYGKTADKKQTNHQGMASTPVPLANASPPIRDQMSNQRATTKPSTVAIPSSSNRRAPRSRPYSFLGHPPMNNYSRSLGHSPSAAYCNTTVKTTQRAPLPRHCTLFTKTLKLVKY